MERESFEDDEVAAMLNQHFVAIKVDREERPDIDHMYMEVCQALTGQGGWPLTVIMTPEQKPFFAGTYFPKRARYGRNGLLEILGQVVQLWEKERERLLRSGEQIARAMQRAEAETAKEEAGQGKRLSEETLHQAYRWYRDQFDPVYGGFGQAPKFPAPHHLSFLLRYWRQTGEKEALAMVEQTLQAMHRGGIYDHLGFGFARYSTDERWLVPHFEKMLYDNALLAIAYLEAFQVTGKEEYAQVAREIFTYVQRDMTSPEGGFYSAEDADAEGEEGKFYVFTPEEIKQVLGREEGELFCRYYGVTAAGNFSRGRSILNRLQGDGEMLAREAGLTARELEKRIAAGREKLFQAREKRVHPHKDDKILTAWNGLMIAALAKGAQVLGEETYAQAARRAADFIHARLVREDGRLLARYRDGEAAYPAYLDDYAFFIWGLLELYESDYALDHLRRALHWAEEMIRLFADERGGFFFTGSDAEALLTRPQTVYDGALPSGNSVAALQLLRLGRMTGRTQYLDRAERLLQRFAVTVNAYPPGYAYLLMAFQLARAESVEIVISGRRDAEDTRAMLRLMGRPFLPQAVRLLRAEGEEEDERAALLPATQHRPMIKGKATAYVCRPYACQEPVTEGTDLQRMLVEAARPRRG